MSIDHIILGIISLEPCSGYDMKMEFEQGGASMLSALSFGSIYPRLRQLQEEGLIALQPAPGFGRQKKVYELTGQGWEELQSWLGQQSDYPIPMRDELLLKMLFWGSSGVNREALMEQLRTRYEESNEVLQYITSWEHNGRSFVDEYTALVLSYIRNKLESELNWIMNTMTQLEGEPALPVQDPKWLSVLQKARRKKAFGLKDE
jgi:PadR family transcriptional regulator, regulatory protein AphA